MALSTNVSLGPLSRWAGMSPQQQDLVGELVQLLGDRRAPDLVTVELLLASLKVTALQAYLRRDR